MARTATKGIDYTSKDYESYRADMLKSLQEKMPEYTDLRESDAGVVIIELLAQGLDVLSLYQDILANEVYITTAEQRENIMKWCKMLGYTPKYATVAKFKQVFELVGAQNTDTLIPKGTVVKTSKSSGEDEILFETMEDLVIPKGSIGTEKNTEGNYLYTVNVYEGTSITNELLGSSSGTASQSFMLKFPKAVLDETFSIFVDSGLGFEKWELVDSFVESSSTSKHFSVSENNDENITVTFGDGIFGSIPPYGKNNIYASYRIGGGSQGNVGAGKISILDTSLALVKSTFNPSEAYSSGSDKEDLESLRINAPLTYKTFYGALTLEDFASVVVRDFVKISEAESRRDPSNPDNIWIYVICKDAEPLSEDLSTEIVQYFEENNGGRKIVGADEIKVMEAIYVPLDLKLDLVLYSDYTPSTVKAKVEDYVSTYFSKGNYHFKTSLSFSQLEKSIQEEVEGVRFVRFTSSYDYVLTPNVGEVYTLNSLEVTVK